MTPIADSLDLVISIQLVCVLQGVATIKYQSLYTSEGKHDATYLVLLCALFTSPLRDLPVL